MLAENSGNRLFMAIAFSEGSGKAMEPVGTKAARSGGWSLPTEGLACNKYNHITSNS